MSNSTLPFVRIKQGTLFGSVSKDLDGRKFYSFKGIPYGRPPVGKLRFKAPLPALPWKGTLDASKEGNCCYSKDIFTKKYKGSEDCLNLNVYTPSLWDKNSSGLPVMMWIHGGGFICGSNSSDMYGPEFLITENVVLVAINYRLGLLGFLSIDETSLGVPGNAGFKDMVLALEWIKENIAHFNGDPNNVTIFGESAGGAAVHLLMLSKMAHGLFHKAIAQSGCALNPWSRARKVDDEVYKVFGCEGKSALELLNHLQEISIETLLQNQDKLEYVLDPNKLSLYGLVIENNYEDQLELPFICEDPIDIIQSGKFNHVPFIIGCTNLEGLVVETYSAKRVINMIKDIEANVPHFLGYKTKSQESVKIGQKIRNFYYKNEEPNDNNKNRLYEMVSDHSFIFGIYTAVRLHAKHSQSCVYFYIMTLKTSLQFLQALMPRAKIKGAAHGDDIAHLFKTKFTPPLLPDSLEYNSIKKFVKLWTHFAYLGNPKFCDTIIWERVVNETIGFLEINQNLTFCSEFLHHSLKFWDEVFANSSKGKKFSSVYC